MRNVLFLALAAFLAMGVHGGIPTSAEGWYTPSEGFTRQEGKGTVVWNDSQGGEHTAIVTVDNEGRIKSDGTVDFQDNAALQTAYNALVKACDNEAYNAMQDEAIQTISDNLDSIFRKDGIDLQMTKKGPGGSSTTVDYTLKIKPGDGGSQATIEAADPIPYGDVVDGRTIGWSRNDAAGKLQLVGWMSDSTCDTTMHDMMTASQGFDREKHYVLTRYGKGNGAVFHYVPMGDRFVLAGMVPDDKSVTTNTTLGAVTDGEISLVGFKDATGQDEPKIPHVRKGESGLAWGGIGDFLSAALFERDDNGIAQLKGYDENADGPLFFGIGTGGSVGWYDPGELADGTTIAKNDDGLLQIAAPEAAAGQVLAADGNGGTVWENPSPTVSYDDSNGMIEIEGGGDSDTVDEVWLPMLWIDETDEGYVFTWRNLNESSEEDPITIPKPIECVGDGDTITYEDGSDGERTFSVPKDRFVSGITGSGPIAVSEKDADGAVTISVTGTIDGASVFPDRISLDTVVDGSSTNLEIKGWKDQSTCDKSIAGLLKGGNYASSGERHDVLCRYSISTSQGRKYALHYATIGKLREGLPPDGKTIVSNNNSKLEIKGIETTIEQNPEAAAKVLYADKSGGVEWKIPPFGLLPDDKTIHTNDNGRLALVGIKGTSQGKIAYSDGNENPGIIWDEPPPEVSYADGTLTISSMENGEVSNEDIYLSKISIEEGAMEYSVTWRDVGTESSETTTTSIQKPTPPDDVSIEKSGNGGTTNLQIKGWADQAACGETMRDILTNTEGQNRNTHQVLCRVVGSNWSRGDGGTLHYLPFGDVLPEAKADDKTLAESEDASGNKTFSWKYVPPRTDKVYGVTGVSGGGYDFVEIYTNGVGGCSCSNKWEKVEAWTGKDFGDDVNFTVNDAESLKVPQSWIMGPLVKYSAPSASDYDDGSLTIDGWQSDSANCEYTLADMMKCGKTQAEEMIADEHFVFTRHKDNQGNITPHYVRIGSLSPTNSVSPDEGSIVLNDSGKLMIAGFDDANSEGLMPVTKVSGMSMTIEWVPTNAPPATAGAAIKLIGTDSSEAVVGSGSVTNTVTFASETDANVTVTVESDGSGNATVRIGAYYK